MLLRIVGDDPAENLVSAVHAATPGRKVFGSSAANQSVRSGDSSFFWRHAKRLRPLNTGDFTNHGYYAARLTNSYGWP